MRTIEARRKSSGWVGWYSSTSLITDVFSEAVENAVFCAVSLKDGML